MDTDALYQLAHHLGITITEHHSGPKGYYQHSARMISLRADLRPVNRRCTLAHELGHAIAGDEPTGNPWYDRRMERAADQFAARLLISEAEYALAEDLYGPSPPAIARELGVTVALINTWQKLHNPPTPAPHIS